MQVLPIIVPYTKTTSNLAISCKGLCVWLSNKGFQIKSSRGDLTLENLSFYRLLNYPKLDRWTNNAFSDAIKDGDCDQLKILLEHKANIEAKATYGITALIWAALKGKVECLKILLDRGANIEAKNDAGWTALLLAARWGKVDCLKILLDTGANIEEGDFLGRTALSLVATYGGTDCLKILLQHGAKVSPGLRKNYPEYAALWGRFYSVSQN